MPPDSSMDPASRRARGGAFPGVAAFSHAVFLADADVIDEGLRFRSLPPNYVAWLLIPLGIAALAWWAYRNAAGAPRPIRFLLAALRALAIFFVFLMIFDPFRQLARIDEVRSLVTILVDESASMARQEPYEQNAERAAALRKAVRLGEHEALRDYTRTQLVQRALGPAGVDLLAKARAKHDVKVLGFSGGKPRPLATLDEAVSDGPVTATGEALQHVLADPDIQAKPNTSVILISDGRTNTGTSEIEVAKVAGSSEKIPIHTIGVGDPDALRDLELRFVRADEVALKGNTVKMSLTVRSHGYDSQWVTVTIVDQHKQSWVAPQRKRVQKSESDQTIEIDFVADRVGSFALDVAIAGPAGEENTRNNTKRHSLVVKDERLRVLYVDTYPRWEYRRLKNFLVRGGESFVAQCLLLSAEPNFIQETTQLSDSSKSVAPLTEFPQDFEQLDKYDVLVFGDVDPNLLVANPAKLPQVLRNIQKFVDNGGGLVVIAGESWTPHAYGDTPLEELLPVDISSGGDVGFAANYIDEWKPKLTPFGRSNPIMQLEADPEENRRIWEERRYGLMDMRWWYPVRRATPAAQVLAYHPDQRNPYGNYPLIVAGTYGDGPVLFIATDETWRWTWRVGPKWFNQFWGNVVRQLSRAHLYRGSKRYKLVASSSEYQQGESVKLTAFVKDKNFDDSEAPTQRVMIVEPDSKSQPREFEKLAKGEYAYTFKPTKFGRYEAWVVGDEGVAGEHYAPITFDVTYVDPERFNAAINEDSLRDVARASQGAYFRLEEADKILERLRADTLRRKKINPLPLRRFPWLPGIFVALVTLEWIVRKKWRMA
jgi:uncharacterized membrane protein